MHETSDFAPVVRIAGGLVQGQRQAQGLARSEDCLLQPMQGVDGAQLFRSSTPSKTRCA